MEWTGEWIFTATKADIHLALHRIMLIEVVFAAVCLVLTMAEMILCARKGLTPIIYLTLQVTKTTIGLMVFILVVIVVATITTYNGGFPHVYTDSSSGSFWVDPNTQFEPKNESPLRWILNGLIQSVFIL